MAGVKLNPILQRVRGKVGDLIFKRLNGTMFIARKPDVGKRVLSPAQVAVTERFRQAVSYGKMAMADPLARAAYQQAAQEKKRPVFSLMIADFFNTPSVDEIDLSAYTGQTGNTIAVRATDDFEVMSVDVKITNMAGDSVEGGPAVKSAESGRWVYTASTSVPPGTQLRVEVTATDRPGHKTTRTENV